MIEEWIKELKEDTQLDFKKFETNFGIANKMAKWLERKENLVSKLIELEKKRRKVERELFEYYKTDYDLTLNTKEEIKLMVQSDPKFLEIDNQVKETERLIKFIDKAIDFLKTKVWEVKYYLEWKKYIEGV